MNAAPGVVVTVRGRPFAVMSFTVAGGMITGIDTIADPERVRRIAAAVLTADVASSGSGTLRGLAPGPVRYLD